MVGGRNNLDELSSAIEAPATNKDLGQHWLRDRDTLEAIVELADVKKTDIVLEIGPGPGDLSELLVNKAAKVVAVEIDPALVKTLHVRFKDIANFTLIHADIRRFDLDSMPKNYKIVANIPYYLTSYLIRILSESHNPPQLCVLLVQKEVAERLLAKPGKLSVLGVTAQTFWQVAAGPVVKAALFNPPPKVDSQAVRLSRRADLPIETDLILEMFQILNGTFNKRRKTLANSLSSTLKTSKLVAQNLLEQADIKSSSRPQELSLEQWAKLTRAVFTHKHKK